MPRIAVRILKRIKMLKFKMFKEPRLFICQMCVVQHSTDGMLRYSASHEQSGETVCFTTLNPSVMSLDCVSIEMFAWQKKSQ